jgi:hypothetical protein
MLSARREICFLAAGCCFSLVNPAADALDRRDF